jgi:glycolate oxidase
VQEDAILVGRDMGEPPALFELLLRRVPPERVLRPRTTAEVVAALRSCRGKMPVTARGLGSCGLGGAVPVGGGAVLDLSHLAGVLTVDEAARTVTVRAGTSFYYVEREAARHGLALRARPTNGFGTVGGWASTGGLGLGSLGAGPFARQIESLEVVRPDGAVERLKPSDGGFSEMFDTEGQLGVITELRVKLGLAADAGAVRGWVFPDLGGVLRLVRSLAACAPRPSTAMIPGRVEELGLPDEVGPGEVLLVQGRARAPLADAAAEGGRPLADHHALRLWNRRFFPMDNPLGPVFLASEAVFEAPRVDRFVGAARKLARRYGVPLHAHCHAVDISGAEPEVLVLLTFPADPRQPLHHLMITPLASVLTSLARRMQARPYGIGIWNTPFAASRFGARRYEELRARKRALDPSGSLNPGKFFELGTRRTPLRALMSPAVLPASLRAASAASPWLMRRRDPSASPSCTADRCISCGACVPMCPAVIATGTESVSARGKLALVRRLESGLEVPRPALLGALRCVKCGQCAEVCARGLALVQAWDDLDARAQRLGISPEGRADSLRQFATEVDAARDRVLERALP